MYEVRRVGGGRLAALLVSIVAALTALVLGAPQPASAATLTDTSVADFGTPGADTYVSDTAGGEVTLKPTEGQEFSDTFASTGWLGCTWPAGPFPTCNPGGATVAGGSLNVNGGFAGTPGTFARPRSLEFRATFGASGFQHAGFTVDWNNDGNWATFSTNASTTQLQARTNVGGTQTNTNVGAPGALVGSSHRYRIEWTAAGVNFFVDDMITPVHVAPMAASPTVSLRPAASDFNVAAPGLSVDWMRMGPYSAAGTFDSRVLDAGQQVNWDELSWDATTPAGTAVALSVRTGDTPVPDGSWSAFAPVANGADIPANSQYLQYSAELSTSDVTRTPSLNEVSVDNTPGPDLTPPTITNRTPAPDATDVARGTNVDVQFSEPMNPSTINGTNVRLRKQGAGADVPASVSYSGTTATIDPNADLDPGAVYDVTVEGGAGGVADAADNELAADDTWSFTTAPLSFIDDLSAEFGAGTPGADTYVSETDDGEVILKPTEGSEFFGSSLPPEWESGAWTGGGASVSGGLLHVDGGYARGTATYGSGRSLEFRATFGPQPNQHAGFGVDMNASSNWAIFSVRFDGVFMARTNNNGAPTETPLPGVNPSLPHLYRIEWDTNEVRYYVDGALVATHNPASIAAQMRPIVSDLTNGTTEIAVDLMRMTPYTASGTFDSRIFDAGAGQTADWGALSWNSATPSGTGIALSVRTGPTPTPDGDWSGFTQIASSGGDIPGSSRYVQYRAQLTTSDATRTPTLSDVSISYNVSPTAVDDSATVAEDSGATAIPVLANDTDPDGGPKTINSVTQPANGEVAITGGGTGLTYQPDAGYCNDGSPTDNFTYTLNGGSTATVAVAVTCADDSPVAVDDTATVPEDSGATAIPVLANDTDPDGGPKTINSVTQPANGEVAITGGGTGLTYQPDAGYCNDGSPTDNFTYTLNGGSDATVHMTVTCAATPPPGGGGVAGGVGGTIQGTPGDDVINGTPGNDVINGGGGNDVINGGAGNDVINGGAGNDTLNGGAGNDTLNGGAGNDTLNGDGSPAGSASQRAAGTGGNDKLNGGAGNDKLNGQGGNDRLRGQGGNDRLRGGPGKDVLIGGPGKDKLVGGPGRDKQKQ